MKRVVHLLLWSGLGLLAGLVLVIVFQADHAPVFPSLTRNSALETPHVFANRGATQRAREVADQERFDPTPPDIERALPIELPDADIDAGRGATLDQPQVPASGRTVVPVANEPTSTPAQPHDNAAERPRGWCFHTGVKDQHFASDSNAVWSGSHSVLIGRDDDNYFARAPGMNTLWQLVDAKPYQGSRLALAVHVKAKTPDTVMLFVDTKSEEELKLRPRAYQTKPRTIARRPVGASWTRLSVVADISPGRDFPLLRDLLCRSGASVG